MRNQILKINKGTGDEILGTNNMKMKQRNIYALSHLFSFPIINHIWQYCGLMKKIFWNKKKLCLYLQMIDVISTIFDRYDH